MSAIMNHGFILGTVLFTVFSQLVIRWQVSLAGPLPPSLDGKLWYVLTLLFNPWVLTSIFVTFLAGVSWMLAMAKFEISYAYPFVSLSYILILAAGFLLFDETISAAKLIGATLVILGIIVIARG